MRIILLSFLMLLISFSSSAERVLITQEDPTWAYIGKYKEIAISEMIRTGIPASIKLAQGILESNCGRSTLAKQAKNHFGIKCSKYWNGDSFYREDDDFEDGLLVKSCFRKYDNEYLSFIAHSDFLTNPGSQYRYGFLFELDPYDYTEWAKGLKKSGYATDPNYANKLISIIESYELYTFDKGNKHIISDEEFVAETSDKKERPQHSKPLKSIGNISLAVQNGEHLVKRGETMKSISDKYNIDLDLFYFQNRMPNGSEPRDGQKLKIEGYFHWGKNPKVDKKKISKNESVLFADESMTFTIQ